jgi:hypothetical protein
MAGDGAGVLVPGHRHVAGFFAAPDPVILNVSSALPPDEVVVQLGQAIRERPYSTPGRNSPGFFRLGGAVIGRAIRVTARPYVVPGLIAGYGAMMIELSGEVVGKAPGSEIRGSVTAPIPRSSVWLAVVSLIVWAVVVTLGNGSNLVSWSFILIVGSAITLAWGWIARHNQRKALRNVGELERLLASVIS